MALRVDISLSVVLLRIAKLHTIFRRVVYGGIIFQPMIPLSLPRDVGLNGSSKFVQMREKSPKSSVSCIDSKKLYDNTSQ